MAHKVKLKQAQRLRGQLQQFAYNALDCIGTRQVFDAVYERLTPSQERMYRFEMAAQQPAFQMTMRGLLVDTEARAKAVTTLAKDIRVLERKIARHALVEELWDAKEKDTGACPESKRKDGKHSWPRGVPDSEPDKRCTECGSPRLKRSPFNANSPAQKAHLLYDLLGLPKQRNKEGNVSTDKDCLLRLQRKSPRYAEFIERLLELTRLKKQAGFLKARLTADGRYPASFTVAKAWTGRWSSKKNIYGEGANAQNVAPKHRHMFVADPGYDLVYMDLKQAESNLVAHISGDERYIQAHKDGNVHVAVGTFIFPEEDWTDDPAANKKMAKSTHPSWDPNHHLYDWSKRFQHGGNYGLSAFGISRMYHIPVEGARKSLSAYKREFPGIVQWHRWTNNRVRNREPIPMPLGFEITMLGRPWDGGTVKQALALSPQGTVAHLINIAAWRVWRHMDPHEVILLAQVHDALLMLVPKGRLDLVRKAADMMTIPMRIRDINGAERTCTLEVEVEIGQNWGKKSDDNPNGMEEVDIG